MFTEYVTPILLTLNEEANVVRSLSKLYWAREIVVVDSGSTDRTIELLRQNARVRLFQRKFTTHADQWNFALKDTSIKTDWVLALDADHVLTDQLIEEVKALAPSSEISGYWIRFRYCVSGRPLWGSLYPPTVSLYRRERGAYVQDGHTQRVALEGRREQLRGYILHDDRKSLSRWLSSQEKYAELEAQKIGDSSFGSLPWRDRIRKLVVIAPPACLLYCLIVKGGVLQGFAGFHYALQRTLAETLIALKLLERSLFSRM